MKKYYRNGDYDVMLDGLCFLCFCQGHLLFEGELNEKAQPVLKPLKDHQVSELRINDTQLSFVLDGQFICLEAEKTLPICNEQLENWQGTYENILFDLQVILQGDELKYCYQGKEFQCRADVVKDGPQYWLMNRQTLQGKRVSCGIFEAFALMEQALVVFLDPEDPGAGRITLRRKVQ